MSLKEKTKQFTINSLDLVSELGTKNPITKTVAYQLARSSSSVGANYRASLRSRSDKEFISKMNIVLEEADESLFWMEIIQEKKLIRESVLLPLMKEANEITAMTVSSLKTINRRVKNSKF
jgi:four helix bundle protein